ncbi:glycosyltransferase [Dyella humi]|uniref:Glycosyltransferase n=1 Tax=Dyella humi TaxID=1770547 RepID=A0ABW8INE6_9GAMM
MNLDLAWRIARLHQLIRRAWGSLALRGWKGTFRRAVEQFNAQQGSAGPDDLHTVADKDLRNRRRILVIDTMLPNPARDSGSLRLCMMLQLLHNEGWHVDLLPDDGRITPADVERLRIYGVHVHPGSVLTWLRKHGTSLDAVLLCRLSVAAPYLTPSRNLAPQAMCIFDTVDLHFLREQRAAEVSGSRRMHRQSVASRQRELALIHDSDVSFVVSEVELDILREELPDSHIELVSNIHEIHGRSSPFSTRRDLLFVGGFGHPPNEDAMRWFVAEILPKLHSRDPSICLHIAGDITPEARRVLEQPGVVIHGRVDDLSTLMNCCKVSIAPLRFGAGVKGKVNMAMSYGLPVVVTPIAAEGMHLTDGVDALIANNATDFASAVWRAYHDEQLWTRLSDASITNVRQYFSPDVARDTLRRVLPSGQEFADRSAPVR